MFDIDKQSMNDTSGIRYKAKDSTIDYSNVERFIKMNEHSFKSSNSNLSENFLSRMTSATTQKSLVDIKELQNMKGLNIRVGTPIEEVKDKDLPSPNMGGNSKDNLFDDKGKEDALVKISHRIHNTKMK
jgi:hypothetical protein